MKKPRTYLSGDYIQDMRTLRIFGEVRNPQKRIMEKKDETPQFITYLTLALQNISDIVGFDVSNVGAAKKTAKEVKDPLPCKNLRTQLATCAKEQIERLASFLWMYRADEPQFDYGKNEHLKKDYADWAKEIVCKLWELRNMFVHSTQKDAGKALLVDPEFVRFIEGELFAEARQRALGPGRRSEKVFKLKLFNPNNDARTVYEFSRKGLIFLVCLALYRHDAGEFIQQFPDLQLPPRAWEVEQGKVNLSERELVELRKKGGTVKAILDAFTFYSMRASRTDIEVDNADYLNFANILLYLNKVPMASYDYLALEKEAKRLAEAAAKSDESEENRRFKYLLHPRQKDRFLTLALAYLEDFKCFPCLKFKRLDVRPCADRRRYLFGTVSEKDQIDPKGEKAPQVNGMDRHYVVGGGVAQFEYEPKQHYGPVQIARLRGGIGEGELMRLMLVMFSPEIRAMSPAKVLEDYLAAYHRILERLLNIPEGESPSLEDAMFRADFKTVSGKGDEALDPQVFVEEMKPFFPANLTRFFVQADLKPKLEELQQLLAAEMTTRWGKAQDRLLKLDRLSAWRELDEETRKKEGRPTFKVGELRFPPRTCKITDAQLIRAVLDYINFYLQKEEKFRQLPRGMRHRGVRDFEFQLLHAEIGRFGTNPLGLWKRLEKRESLNGQDGPLDVLKARESELFSAEKRRCRGKLDKNGRPLRVGHTLTMLAYAATELYAEACEDVRNTWCGPLSEEDRELLPYVCSSFGVRPGLPLDRVALVKTILGIDLATWSHAYDYAAQKPRETARLLEGAANLTVSQVPVPNALAIRGVTKTPPAWAVNEVGTFGFMKAFNKFLPYDAGKMALRDYYDVAPLIEGVKKLSAQMKGRAVAEEEHQRANACIDTHQSGLETRGGKESEAGVYGKEPPSRMPSWSRSDVNAAIKSIQLVERQDKILLACAKAYWNRYMAQEAKSTDKDQFKRKLIKNLSLAEATDIGLFFEQTMESVLDGVKVRLTPNDFARPAYGTVVKHIKELVARTKPIEGTDLYAFYDLVWALRELQREENTVRLGYLPALAKFMAFVGEPPKVELKPTPEYDKPTPEQKQELRAIKAENEELVHAHICAFFNSQLKPLGREALARDESDLLVALDTRLRHPSKGEKSLLFYNLEAAARVLRRYGFPVKER